LLVIDKFIQLPKAADNVCFRKHVPAV